MTRHLGRIALTMALASWLIYIAALFAGGLDPAPSRLPFLRVAVMTSMILPMLAAILSVVALVVGPQRWSAAIALCLALLFGLMFTGLLWALLA